MALVDNEFAEETGEVIYRPMAEINMTPFVDVVLVLLVIFMIAAPLMVQGVAVTLPRTAGAITSPVTQPLIVTLARDRSLYIRDQKVDPADLVDELKALRAKEGETTVYVRADKGAPYGDVMELLGQVGAGGYQRVSLLAQPVNSVEAVKAR